MKDYKKLLNEYDSRNTNFIQHEWGQNKNTLYNLVAKVWNKISVGDKIVITSYKHFGIKNTVNFLKEHGITCLIVGKGPENLRLVECEKTTNKKLPLIKVERTIEFDFRGKKYQVDVEDTIFSKTGLDEGTKFLLEVFFEKEIDLNNKEVGDFGTGWGAISLILANEFSKSRITAYEKDEASFEAAKINLRNYPNVSVVNVDLTKINSAIFVEKQGVLDYIISNPPFHSTPKDKELIFENAFNLLKRRGELFFVAENSFAPRFRKVVLNFFMLIKEKENDLYTIFWYQKKRHASFTGTKFGSGESEGGTGRKREKNCFTL